MVIQGFGNVGGMAAKLMARDGLQDHLPSWSTMARSTIRNGLDIAALQQHRKETGSITGFSGRRGHGQGRGHVPGVRRAAARRHGERDSLRSNADRLRCKILCEGANGPTTPLADEILAEKKVFVIPDILANAGGVTVSYFEWVQDRQGFFWNEQLVNERLQEIMDESFDAVVEYADTHNVNNRIAAYMLALDRVAYAIKLRGHLRVACMSADASTPLMRQYNSIKQQVPNALLMFRLGDFYELFFEDAVIAARELEITLTARNKEKGAAIPMCGVPYHAAEGYISRLIQKGYRVAICDQVEDPQARQEAGQARDHAHRHAGHRDGREPGALAREQLPGGGGARDGHAPAVAHVDVSTGEFRVTEMDARRSGRRARTPGRARGAVSRRPAAAHRRGPRRPALRAHRTRRLDLHPRLRRPHAARPFQAALARWLRAGQPARRGRRRRRDPALPARHAARRARSPRPPHVSTTAPIPWCWTPSRCATWN